MLEVVCFGGGVREGVLGRILGEGLAWRRWGRALSWGMKKVFLKLLFLLGAGGICFGAEMAQGVVLDVVTPRTKVSAGERVAVSLVALNPTSGELLVELPAELKGRLVDGKGKARELSLEGEEKVPVSGEKKGVWVASQGFLSGNYWFVVPEGLEGKAVLEVEGAGNAVLEVDGKAKAVSGKEVKAPVETGAFAGARGAWIADGFAQRFGMHEPVYFIGGWKAPAVKFQFSFKYRIFSEEGLVGEKVPVLRKFFLAYTQRSLWDVQEQSSPFYDTSYMPELFYEFQKPASEGWFSWLGYQAGYKHESNGKGGTDSRSMNMLYVKPAFLFGKMDGWRVIFAPRLFCYIFDMSDNPDMSDFRGYVEWALSAGKSDGLMLSVLGRVGTDWKGSVELNATYPLSFGGRSEVAYFLVQLFTGYGESLRDYDKRSTMLRAGLSLVR